MVVNRVELVEHPSEEKFFERCTNCAVLPRPLSCDHLCENSASLLFHSSAGERLQISLPRNGLIISTDITSSLVSLTCS